MPSPEIDQTVRKESSMRQWFPRLQETGVPVPETEWVPIREWEEATKFTETVPMPLVDLDAVREAIESVGGPPAFLRSDQASNKHGMGKASRVSQLDETHLYDHVFETLMYNEMAFFPLPYTHLAVREWLDLKHEFTAFHETPIASELRFFINDGAVYDAGFYWPADAIKNPDSVEWKRELADLREHALSQVYDVADLAERVAAEFDGYWSLDFAETVDGEWYAIDMAVGAASWHPDGVEPPEGVPRPE